MIQRTFMPGSEWLFLKIYTGNKTAEKLLEKEIRNIVKYLQSEKEIEKWFFLRYSDPDYHIRIRFLTTNPAILGIIYKKLQPAIKQGKIWKMQVDTYNRELERYHPALIEVAESIFYNDSKASLEILPLITNEDVRWMASVKMIDAFLSDFLLDLDGKLQIMTQMSEAYKKEFGYDKNFKPLGDKYREHRKMVEEVLENKHENDFFIKLSLILQKRSKDNIPVIAQFKEICKKKKIESDRIINSYIHMMMNRLFIHSARMHELLIYYFLYKYYLGKKARNKN